MLTMSFNAIGSLFKSVIKFSQIWILPRSPRISPAMSRSSVYLSTTLHLHQPQYPTTEQDVINSIVQCWLSRNTFLHFSTSQKATRAAAYFCQFIKTGSEERLAVTSPRTISMRYKSCKVSSFSQKFPKIFLY